MDTTIRTKIVHKREKCDVPSVQEDMYNENAQQPNLSVLIVEDSIGPWRLHAASEKK